MALTTLPTAALANDAVDNTKLNLADNYAFTGTVTGAGGGKLLQVQHGTYGTQNSISTTSPTASNLSVSITPTSTSNKILVMGNLAGCRMYANTYMSVWLYRQINGGGYSSIRKFENGFGYLQGETETLSKSFYYQDTPNTTNQVDYQIYFSYNGSGDSVAINIDSQEWSTITAMEIDNS
jgi:hypothetical protein